MRQDTTVGYDTRVDGIDYTICTSCADDPKFDGCELEPVLAGDVRDAYCDECDESLESFG